MRIDNMGIDLRDRDIGAGEHAAASGGGLARLSIVSLAVSCLFAGGVFWMKQAQDASSPKPPPPAPIQVTLVTAPQGASTVATSADALEREPRWPVEATDALARRPAPEASQSGEPPDPTPSIETPTPPDRFAAIERPLTAAAAPTPPKLALDSVTDRFRRAVSERLARVKRYPPDARKQGLHGAAVVRFVIRRDGAVSDVTLVSSAGHTALDQEAFATIGRSQPLPRIPASLPAPMTLTVPINFSLR